ncbi:RNA polymerase II transcription factor B subunit 5 [Xylona heveae TC161]|uniref:General transcription and DNA repair factor IIH subunit TFB5 n=1 Tax=Xylona heveae (strain CBS 132557 / TC161) TaxID=1328760 RepID=A0A165JGU8_XYLHT|nr:RNA polymerase II transcription factor B subunit 5 [Xylona heveae TC161]KZF26220.1 RNA polymerase II transcription factor B subunit 5 [Xylona heveae TC161]
MPKAVKGVLVQCDPSIKAIILKIDALDHDFIVEDLDDQTLVVKESKLVELKQRLEDELSNTQQMPEESGSE